MKEFYTDDIAMSPRIRRLIDNLYENMPEVEADRAELITESYKQTEDLPVIMRRALAFKHILENIPITIRDDELIVGSATKAPRGCQTFPEFSYEWLESELDTMEKRAADPFYVSEDTKKRLRAVFPYWKGKTTSELATAYMAPEAQTAIAHNIFTPGNYFYNGVGHVTVCYGKILEVGYKGVIAEAQAALDKLSPGDAEYSKSSQFLQAVIISCEAVCAYAKRYSALAAETAKSCKDPNRRRELEIIAKNCANVPENPAGSFYEAMQSFWFIQMLLQIESSGHSISPGRFDQYMYPYYKKDIENGSLTREFAQELTDCVWVKLNDLNKARDKDSAEGFAGYSLFQNLIVGGQDVHGADATNDMSFHCIRASMHTQLPQPSFSARVWNGTPHIFMLKCAELTRTGVGLPAYYNDEVIIPSLMSRGLTMDDARDYNIIGCVEPQKAAKTEGWHDAAFFNMCRPLELVFSDGADTGQQIGPHTGDVTQMRTFDEFYDAYKTQMNYMISLLVNADNAIDVAHAERAPLPFLSSMIDNCIERGKSVQEGGAIYNFTGPQGFGVANMADALYAVKKLVFEDKVLSMSDLRDALADNFGKGMTEARAEKVTEQVVQNVYSAGKTLTENQIMDIYSSLIKGGCSQADKDKYQKILDMINSLPKFGNDDEEIDAFARDVAYTYTRPLETYKNPRGGQFQAGLYPVSANVPLGAQTGATPDGRLANTPVADGVSPAAGRDKIGPTAAANSVARLDHFIASNGTLFNQKFHPSALAGQSGLEAFVALIRSYFDRKGMHMQFNVVSRETLIDAQKHPEKYKSLVVRVAGYSALFTSLSKSLQDDIINRTEQGF
jgi:formate C-acetyltransferase